MKITKEKIINDLNNFILYYVKHFNAIPSSFSIWGDVEDTSLMTFDEEDKSWVIVQENFKYFS